ncbi:MAG: double-strand break repair protein AddB, partial [Parvibaculaceae bacterium]
AIIRDKLPAILRERDLVGPAERRSQLLRLEAKRLAEEDPQWPVIAAGSTGTIPAAAELLKTIAGLRYGAVVLPGLDLAMDDESWSHVGPQHPQNGLKQLLAGWHVERRDVAELPGLMRRPLGQARAVLTTEMMRPTEAAAGWRAAVRKHGNDIRAAVKDVSLIEARTRPEEALAIALIMRGALEKPDHVTALVTPDRSLARRVRDELARWDIAIADSAGEPLIRTEAGSLAALLIAAAQDGFEAASLLALLHHPLARFGVPEDQKRPAAGIIEAAIYRYGQREPQPGRLAEALRVMREIAKKDHHAPLFLKRLDDAAWASAEQLAVRADVLLQPLADHARAAVNPLAAHIACIRSCIEAIAESPWDAVGGETLHALFDTLAQADGFHALSRFAEAAAILSDLIAHTPVRAPQTGRARLMILGLLEARLIPCDTVILGGLNEGKWPAQPDTGPWLNRPMRKELSMSLPERNIGLTAHDFVQGFAAPRVVLACSKRIDDQPAVPSRWIQRLHMLLAMAGAELENGPWLDWARALSAPEGPGPVARPAPLPPVHPESLSITQVETLLRDPYEIYARKVLVIEPLDEIAAAADASLRGQLVHEALNRFTREYPVALPPDAEAQLIAIGHDVFRPYRDDPDVAGFWWPRFERVAAWFVAEDAALRASVDTIISEKSAAWECEIAGLPFRLTGRADRIDLLKDGTARIVDYKTGQVPTKKQVDSGLAPQLTLEAALLELSAFRDVPARASGELLYVKLSGGSTPGEVLDVTVDDLMVTARAHLDKLRGIIALYRTGQRPYVPRLVVEKTRAARPYDHLARFGEWSPGEGEDDEWT